MVAMTNHSFRIEKPFQTQPGGYGGRCRPHVPPAGVSGETDMIREGDQPGPVFVILKGWACRYKILRAGRGRSLAFLLPGDACDLHIGMLLEMITTCKR